MRIIGAIAGAGAVTANFWWSGVDLLSRNPENRLIGCAIICGAFSGYFLAALMTEEKK